MKWRQEEKLASEGAVGAAKERGQEQEKGRKNRLI